MSILSAESKKYKVGDSFPSIELEDQFAVLHKTSPQTRHILLVFDMPLSKKVKKWISGKEKNFLEKRNVLLVTDISKMPKIITWLFAKRKMKKYPFKMLLATEGDFSKSYDHEDGKVTLISQDKNAKISSIELIEDLDVLSDKIKNKE